MLIPNEAIGSNHETTNSGQTYSVPGFQISFYSHMTELMKVPELRMYVKVKLEYSLSILLVLSMKPNQQLVRSTKSFEMQLTLLKM